jgi:hypothetical protein
MVPTILVQLLSMQTMVAKSAKKIVLQ